MDQTKEKAAAPAVVCELDPTSSLGIKLIHKSTAQRIKSTDRVSEIYGFVMWVTTYVLFAVFLLWAYLPDSTLHSLGVTYYPSKYWALALPAWVTVTLIFALVFYCAYNLYSTNPLQSRSSIQDQYSRYMDKAELTALEDRYSIPEIADLSIHTVNKLMYQSQKRTEASLRPTRLLPR